MAGKPGRKPKFTPDELKARTLATALGSVLAKGVAAGVDAIRIERVIVEAETPRAATYELWDGEGDGTSQENLRRAVVIEIVRNMPAGNVSTSRSYAAERIAAHADRFERADPDDLRELRAELIRDVTGANHAMLQSQRWRVYKTFTSSIATGDDAELREAVAAGEAKLLDDYGTLFGELADLFGLELRAPYTMDQFAMSAYALNEGLSNRVGTAFSNQTLERDGAEWTIFAVGFEALVDHYFRETPASTASEQPAGT